MFTHVSFDVWNTLISSNPEFAKARTQAISDILGVDLALVRSAYTAVKTRVDHEAELNGAGYSNPYVYQLLLDELQLDCHQRSDFRLIGEMQRIVDGLFLELPPKIDVSTKEAIRLLRYEGCTVSIASNTNFISGYVMGPWLTNEFGSFKFMLFSDIERVSKPHPTFFNSVITLSNVDNPTKIMHIGDNPICDVKGPNALGIRGVLVNSPLDVYTTVNNMMKDNNNATV